MSDSGGPWGREGDLHVPARAPVSRRRLWGWLAVLAGLGGGVWLLFRAFPGAVSTAEDKAWLARSIGVTVLVCSGLLVGRRRIALGQAGRYVAIWAGIVMVLAVGVSYRAELEAVVARVRGEFTSAYPTASGPAGSRELVVSQDQGGGFFVMGKVNGRLVRFLVDTGASDTVLSPDDARRVGIVTAGMVFDHAAETANGTGYGAAYVADSLEVGSIRLAEAPMVINQAPMTSSLLGMSFLKQLESFQVRDGKLYLKPR
jgi:aspartyl protease family protein